LSNDRVAFRPYLQNKSMDFISWDGCE